jgi:hypothetical protein
VIFEILSNVRANPDDAEFNPAAVLSRASRLKMRLTSAMTQPPVRRRHARECLR